MNMLHTSINLAVPAYYSRRGGPIKSVRKVFVLYVFVP